jgi:hypothetical protein
MLSLFAVCRANKLSKYQKLHNPLNHEWPAAVIILQRKSQSLSASASGRTSPDRSELAAVHDAATV